MKAKTNPIQHLAVGTGAAERDILKLKPSADRARARQAGRTRTAGGTWFEKVAQVFNEQRLLGNTDQPGDLTFEYAPGPGECADEQSKTPCADRTCESSQDDERIGGVISGRRNHIDQRSLHCPLQYQRPV